MPLQCSLLRRPTVRLFGHTGSYLPLLASGMLLLVVFLALWWALSPAPDWQLDVGAPDDSAFLTDFYAPETSAATSFRWSGPYSRLRLSGDSAGPFALQLRLNGELLHQAGDPTLHLKHHGRHIAAFDAAPE